MISVAHFPTLLLVLLSSSLFLLIASCKRLLLRLHNSDRALVGWLVIFICRLLSFFQKQDAQLPSATRVIYKPRGWLRMSTQWDQRGNRFLVSFYEGGMGSVAYSPSSHAVEEVVLVPTAPQDGLSNIGFSIDYPRNRVVCCASDKKNLLCSSIVAYDYSTWDIIFFLKLAGPEKKSLACFLTINNEGDIYVSDAYMGCIWKVKADGSQFEILSDSPLFRQRPIGAFYRSIRLTGILYHPNGFLLVVHMAAHVLLKVSIDGKDVKVVKGPHPQLLGEGMVLVNDNKIAMASMHLGVYILETIDNWETANVTQHCLPPFQRLANSVFLKDGDIFVSFVNGFWIPYTCIIGQPIFNPLSKHTISE